MKRIFIVTSNRADYGLMSNLINLLKKDKTIILKLIVTGSHLEKKYGYTINEIITDNINPDHIIKIPLKAINPIKNIESITNYMKDFSKFLHKQKPDLLVLLGDRYEIFSIAVSSFIHKIPIMHLYGGESTLGVFDDFFRYSISKTAKYHLVSNKLYAKKLESLGENKKNIFTVGSLGCENIKLMDFEQPIKLEKKFNFKFLKKNILVSFHPETLSEDYGLKGLNILLASLSTLKDTMIIFTGTNPDIYNQKILKQIKKFVSNNQNSKLIYSMGKKGYLSCLKHCNLIIGNSSSGIIEAPSLNTPSINLGNRQEGRIFAKSVINVKFNKRLIIKKINKFLYNKKRKKVINPYYKKNTTNEIIRIIKEI
ncbi:UDP-N-acetylglucosamine 2-epimerase [Candidatus Pelagibacter sp.]|nr:UDP-N-acetylglucosamine 2-epimerase [Candidatus Pelagibacter sp.]